MYSIDRSQNAIIDTVKSAGKDHKVIKLIELFPSKKIKSEEGVIIPKEALQMTKLQPAKYMSKKEEKNYDGILWGSIIILLILVVIKIVFNKVRDSKN